MVRGTDSSEGGEEAAAEEDEAFVRKFLLVRSVRSKRPGSITGAGVGAAAKEGEETKSAEKGRGEDGTSVWKASSKNEWSASERLRLALAGAKPCWIGDMVPAVVDGVRLTGCESGGRGRAIVEDESDRSVEADVRVRAR